MTLQPVTYFEAIYPHVVRLHARWRQFLGLFTVSDERMEALSRTAPGFFAIVRDVMRDDAFICLSRLTDRTETGGHANLTLVGLLEEVESTFGAPAAADASTLLDQLLDKVTGIRKYRDKTLAHIDLTRALQYDPPPLARVQRGDVDDALRLTREFMNAVAGLLGRDYTAYEHVVVPGDAEHLAHLLERHSSSISAA